MTYSLQCTKCDIRHEFVNVENQGLNQQEQVILRKAWHDAINKLDVTDLRTSTLWDERGRHERTMCKRYLDSLPFQEYQFPVDMTSIKTLTGYVICCKQCIND